MSYGQTSNYDTEKLLKDDNVKNFRDKFIKARETTQRVDVNVVKRDVEKISLLHKLSNDLDGAFDTIQTSLAVMAAGLTNEIQSLRRRIDFHSDRGLGAVKYIVEHDFLRGWEVFEERAINHLTNGFFEKSDMVDNIIKQMNSSDLDEGSRHVLYLIIEKDLHAMEKQAERALEFIIETQNAYMNGEPLLTYRYTLDRRYDMNYIPDSLLRFDPKEQTRHFYELTNNTNEFIDSIKELRKSALFVSKNKVFDNETEKAYEKAQKAFINACKGFNYRRFQYKSKVVIKPLELLEERIESFESFNESLNVRFKELERIMDSISGEVEKVKSETWLKLESLVKQAVLYTEDLSTTKVDLAVNLTNRFVYEDTRNLELFFSALRDRYRELDDAVDKLQDAMLGVWAKMLTEETTREIYQVMNKDVQAMVEDPEKREFYIKHFAYMLRVNKLTLKDATADSFYWRLNADFANMTGTDVTEQYRKHNMKYKVKYYLTSFLSDKDQEFLEAFSEVQESLKTFLDGNRVNYDFVR